MENSKWPSCKYVDHLVICTIEIKNTLVHQWKATIPRDISVGLLLSRCFTKG